MVQDFNRDFAATLTSSVSTTLKKWAGLFRNADVDSLFRSRQTLGLGLTSVVDYYERMQLIKCCLLQHSKDRQVVAVFESRQNKQLTETGRVWRATAVTRRLESDVAHQLKFPTQQGRLGLGSGNFNPNPSTAEKRALVISASRLQAQQRYQVHAHSLALQGAWLKWADTVAPFDLSWKNLIYGNVSHVVRFILNATINCAATPDMYKLWGYKAVANCPLCNKKQCTLHHILSNCDASLKSKRYTWRHDSVLSSIEPVLRGHIEKWNKSASVASIPHISRSFVPAGHVEQKTAPVSGERTALEGAHDWNLLVDYDHLPIVFPPEITATPQRPDVVIWSVKAHKVILIELTCPAEEGIDPAHIRKVARYEPLCTQISQTQPKWNPLLMTIEVGARGFVAHSVRRCFRRLGISKRGVRTLIRNLSEVVARCSYAIYLARSSIAWQQRNLITVQ